MSKSMEISSRFWNQRQKGEEEAARETTYIDDIIQKAHLEREILSRLDGIKTVFDGGAGSGRFSILLAKRGLQVTHFDLSKVMIEKARQTAQREGVSERITFIHGALENLNQFVDRQFDMVLSFDAPISYTYPRHEEVIGNLVRLASKRIVISVYSRMGWMPYLFNPAQKVQYILDKETTDPFARWCLDYAQAQVPGFIPNIEAARSTFNSGLMESAEQVAAAFDQGKTPWPVSYGFMPDELEGLLKRYGAKDIKLSGPGALSRSIPNEILVNIMQNPGLKREFLEFCYNYDSQLYNCGMGKDNLVASADV